MHLFAASHDARGKQPPSPNQRDSEDPPRRAANNMSPYPLPLPPVDHVRGPLIPPLPPVPPGFFPPSAKVPLVRAHTGHRT